MSENTSKIYTKTGDQGETSLGNGQRVSKDSERIEAYGLVDELNAIIGLALSDTPKNNSKLSPILEDLSEIQNRLFDIGSRLACPGEEASKRLPKLQLKSIEKLEKRIDECTAQLPPLKNFIIPGGEKFAAYLHLARTVSRRAERQIIRVHKTDPVETEILGYLNRLSDYFFTTARFANQVSGKSDLLWKKN